MLQYVEEKIHDKLILFTKFEKKSLKQNLEYLA